MKSAIFLTWFFTIVFFSHGLNGTSAGASCNVALAGQQATQPAINRLKPVELPPETAAAEMIPAAYAATEVEPAAGNATPRFNPRLPITDRFGADAESYYQQKQDHLMEALMGR